MKNVTFTFKTRKAYGKPLTEYGVSAELQGGGEYTAYESLDEVPADKRMTDAQILDVINAKEQARVGAAARTALYESVGIEAPVQTPEEKALNHMVKGLIMGGFSEEEAVEFAKTALASKK